MFDLLCTCIVSCLFLCSYVVLMPLVTNCIVNSLENERNWWLLVNSLDINSVDCWLTVHIYSSYCSFTTVHHHGSIRVASIKEGSQTGRLGCWGAPLSSFTSGSIQAPLQKKPQHAVRFIVRWTPRLKHHDEWREGAAAATHWSRTCLPLSEQNDQVHVGRTLADSEREGKGRLGVHTHAETESVRGVSLKTGYLRIRRRVVWQNHHVIENSHFRMF